MTLYCQPVDIHYNVKFFCKAPIQRLVWGVQPLCFDMSIWFVATKYCIRFECERALITWNWFDGKRFFQVPAINFFTYTQKTQTFILWFKMWNSRGAVVWIELCYQRLSENIQSKFRKSNSRFIALLFFGLHNTLLWKTSQNGFSLQRFSWWNRLINYGIFQSKAIKLDLKFVGKEIVVGGRQFHFNVR